MPRSYFRTLPDLYERKALGTGSHPPYPAAAVACFVGVLCFGEQQSPRGRFKSERLLMVLLEGPNGMGRAIARQVPFLIEQGDLIVLPDGSLYIEGWDELQEGNWQTAERMARYRDRHRGVTPTVTPVVTVPVTGDPSRVVVEGRGSGRGQSAPVTMDEMYDAPETEALQWLSRHGVSLSETNGIRRKLIEIVEKFGTNAVIGKFDRLLTAGVLDGDARGFVFGASDSLYPKPDLKALDREERAEDEAARFNRQVERTRLEMAKLRGEA